MAVTALLAFFIFFGVDALFEWFSRKVSLSGAGVILGSAYTRNDEVVVSRSATEQRPFVWRPLWREDAAPKVKQGKNCG